MVRPVIVVSTGRSGSTLVSNMVRQHPDLLSLSEFFVLLGDEAFPEGPVTGPRFWEILSRPSRRIDVLQRSGVTFAELLYRPGRGDRFTAETGIPPVLNVTLPHLVDDPLALYDELAEWVPGLDTGPVADHYRSLFAWLCERMGRRVWVERSGASLPMLAAVSRLFPEAGIVHLYRDGRECAMSMSRHDGFKLMALRLRPELTRDLAPDLMDGELINSGALRAAEVPPEVAGGVWSDLIVAGVACLNELGPDRLVSIRYETLVADPTGELRRLAAFIGVEADPDWLTSAGGLVRPQPARWTRLPEPERRRLVDACAPGMRLLYGDADA